MIDKDRMKQIVTGLLKCDEDKKIVVLGRLNIDEQRYLMDKFNQVYREGNSLISDKVYDALEEMVGATDNVGYDIDDNNSRKEPMPIELSSLEKAKSFDEFKQWIKSKNISSDETMIITPKYDGISLLNRLVTPGTWTRGRKGDGMRSDNHFKSMVGPNHKSFSEPPESLRNCSFVNGEAIIRKDVFEEAPYRTEFANGRSFVASNYSRDVVQKNIVDIDYIAYSSPEEFDDKDKMIDAFNEINQVKVPYVKIKLRDITDEYLQELFVEYGEDYEIDGLVIDINDQFVRETLGKETNGNPKYAIAWKGFSEESADTTIASIDWEVGKTGNVTPVGNINPVELDNTTVSRVTLYNAAFVRDNKIAIDTKVTIIKSGNIIPKVIAVEGVKIV